MAANNISTLPTKEERQLAKLELAQTKRQQTGTNGYRENRYYDVDLLPTKYVGNDVVNNPNVDGLQPHRPWKTTPNTVAGLWRTRYNGDWDGDPTWFDGNGPVEELAVTDFSLGIYDGQPNTSFMWIGYFRAPHTGNYTFYMNSDDLAALWLGPDAITNYDLDTVTLYSDQYSEVSTSPIALTAGTYYPIRVMYGNGGGPGYFTFQWSDDVVIPFPTFESINPAGITINTVQHAGFTITVQSSSFNAVPRVNATISINDLLTVDTSSRGHTVLAMNDAGTVIEQTTFDTYGDDDTASVNNQITMAAAITNYPTGTVVAICSYDATGLWPGLRTTLNTYYGGTNTTEWSRDRVSHIFIGQRV